MAKKPMMPKGTKGVPAGSMGKPMKPGKSKKGC
jgi:hypothetical protein